MIVMIYGVAVFVSFYVGLQQQHHHYAGRNSTRACGIPRFVHRSRASATIAVIFFSAATYKTMGIIGRRQVWSRNRSADGWSLPTTNNPERTQTAQCPSRKCPSPPACPCPQVYVMDNEEGINAFAAGHSTSDAAVAVNAATA